VPGHHPAHRVDGSDHHDNRLNQAVAVLAFDACVVIGLTWFTAMLWHERSHF
jgi:hypothetical protein